MRLIDADALREVIGDHVTSVSVCPTVDWARGKRQMQEIALEDIDNAPTIDAAPVSHGRWVEETDRENHWHCSACGYVTGLAGLTFKYCPECGAELEERHYEID